MIKGIIKEMKDIRKFVNDNQYEIILFFSGIFIIGWIYLLLLDQEYGQKYEDYGIYFSSK